MWKNLDVVSLIQSRVLSDLLKYVQSIKSEVKQGIKAADPAARQVELYGHGLSKALFLTEDVLSGPNLELHLLVDRLVHEVRNTPKVI